MKILRVLTRPNIGGPMRQAIALWHAHAAMGHRTLLALGRCDLDEPSFELRSLGIPLLRPDRIRSDSVGMVEIPELRRRPGVLGELRARSTLRRILRNFVPDVVHTHTSKAGWHGRRIASYAPKHTVLAHTYHGHVLRDYYRESVSKVLRSLERRLTRSCDLVFAVSESCRNELQAMGILGRHGIIVQRPAVDRDTPVSHDRDEARQRLGLPHGGLVLGFVGRLVQIKRPELYVELLQRLPDAHGVVFGDGPLRDLLSPLGSRVHHQGVVPDVAAFLQAMDMLVLPSAREGYPLAAVEAAALGIPTLGFAVPGVKDVVDETGLGYLAPPESGVGGLVQGVEALQNRSGDERYPGVSRVLAATDPKAVATELAQRYQEALDARQASLHG